MNKLVNPVSCQRRGFRSTVVSAGLLLLLSPLAHAQPDSPDEEEEIFELSPFTVEGSSDSGYAGTQTLGGTRIRADLKDLAASISVVTKEFLQDTGTTNSGDLLVYTTNTEVGGLGGNFSGIGNTGNLNENLTAPTMNTRIRGLTAASNTRDYFQTDIPWDGYNISGVEIQRGPNSILFGIASPAGLINTMTDVATYNNSGSFTNTIDKFGRMRNEINVNKVLVEDLLAVRIAAVDDREEFRQDPAFSDSRRYFAALKYEPRLLGQDNSPLTIKGNIESGRIDSNRPRTIPANDRISNFWDPNGLNQRIFHPQFAWRYGYQMDRGTRNSVDYPQNRTPQMGQQMPGWGSDNPYFFYNSDGVSLGAQQGQARTNQFAIGPDGKPSAGIDGFYEAIRYVSVAGMNEYSQNANRMDATQFPAAAKGFYKDFVIRDPKLFDFYNKLIDGPNKGEWTDWKSYSFSLAQRFKGDRFGVEYAHDKQDLTRGGDSLFENAITVDINSHLLIGDPKGGSILSSWTIPPTPEGQTFVPAPDPSTVSGGIVNPNRGRAFISGQGSGNDQTTTREAQRITAFADLRASDYFDSDSLLSRILGRNIFTAVASRDQEDQQRRSWQRSELSTDWTENQGFTSTLNGRRNIAHIVYISDDLRNFSGPQEVDLDRVMFPIQARGSYSVGYFDSNWNAPEVDPSAEWIRPIDGADSSQSENPANYLGWEAMPVTVLDSRGGDIASLVRSGSKKRTTIDSVGLVWQGHLFDGLLIPTYGWRQDEVLDYGRGAPAINTLSGVTALDYENPRPGGLEVLKGETSSWGVVLNVPQKWEEMLPFSSSVRFFYGESENFIPENRVGFDTMPLPAPQGTSQDYGFEITSFDGRLSLKTTFYETTQTNAGIPGGNPLGNNSWYLATQESRGTLHALIAEFWRNREAPGNGWMVNYSQPDSGWSSLYPADPSNNETWARVLAHPSMIAQEAAIKDWYATMPPQAYFDNLGMPINREALQSDDWNVRKKAVTKAGWNQWAGYDSAQSTTNGTVGGLSPTGTIDQLSEGIEFEINARPIDNWNLQLNVSKVEAARGELGESFVDWIESRKERYDGPAGDIRQWWAGDRTVREYFNDFIYSPYLFQKEATGQAAPEIRNWRFNFVTTYSFQDGKLKGLRVGGGYRWEDDIILGYGLNDAKDNLDVNRPFHGGSVDGVDLWLGYSKKLSDKVDWDIQLNIRDAGDDPSLVPVSINPDGMIAAMRITEGQRWQLRNTFKF